MDPYDAIAAMTMSIHSLALLNSSGVAIPTATDPMTDAQNGEMPPRSLDTGWVCNICENSYKWGPFAICYVILWLNKEKAYYWR